MLRDVLQCCYSNVTTADGGSATGGWKPLAVSPGIPDTAYQNCVRMQSSRSEITRFGDCRDENGNILNLMELIGEDGYLYFLRTQFGLKERAHGREINFSHALIFPCADREQIRDPNRFLTILNENFKYTPEEAAADQGEVLRGEPYVLEEALQRCGIDAGEYCLLMECIYQKMTDWMVKEPLYVRYDGTEEHMRALLYCIYMGLPYGLRREFSAGPVPADVIPGKNVVFTLHTEGRNAYIDPETGQNNVLNENLEAQIRELGFVTWVPEHFENPDFEIDRYYSRLEELARSYGDFSASDERILKIAHIQMQEIPLEELTEEELLLRLNDALRSPSGGNEAMDGVIAALMDEIRNRSGWIGDRNEKLLEKRLRSTRSEALRMAADAWQFYSFSGRLTADEMAAQLRKMSPEKYAEYSERLKTSETGLAALDKYYLSGLQAEPEPAMEWLQAYIGKLMEFDPFWNFPETKDEIERLGKERYQKELDREIRKTWPKLTENYKALISLLGGLHGEEELKSYKEWAREEIWKRIDFSNISFQASDQYTDSQIVLLGDDRCRMYLNYIDLPNVLRCEVNEPDFLVKYTEFFHKYCLSLQTDEGKAAHETMMKWLKYRELYSDESFPIWCRLALVLPSNALVNLLAIYTAWEKGASDIMAEELVQLVEKRQESDIPENVQKSLADFLLKLCVRMDSRDKTVSLNTWLTIAGFGSLRNCFDFFRLFDEKRNGRCYFLKDENYDIVSCERFREERFRREAAEYAAQNGPEAETVKRWLQDVQKWEKKEEAQAKRNKKLEKKKATKIKMQQDPEDEKIHEVPNLEEETAPKHPENEVDNIAAIEASLRQGVAGGREPGRTNPQQNRFQAPWNSDEPVSHGAEDARPTGNGSGFRTETGRYESDNTGVRGNDDSSENGTAEEPQESSGISPKGGKRKETEKRSRGSLLDKIVRRRP